MEIPVVFKNHDEQIVGMLHRPEPCEGAPSGAKFPGVLFFHGFTGHKIEVRRMFVRVARHLAEKGIMALRFDFRGSGDSEGEFSQMRIPGLLKDAQTALGFLREQPDIDSNRIGLVGFSLGGMIASQVLASNAKLKAAVLWSAVAHPGPLVDDLRNDWSWNAPPQRSVIDLGGWSVSRTFVNEYAKVKPIDELAGKKLDTNILLIHGNEDESVPVGHSYDYQRTFEATGAKVSLQIVEGAGHTYESIEQDRLVISQTVKWLGKHLR